VTVSPSNTKPTFTLAAANYSMGSSPAGLPIRVTHADLQSWLGGTDSPEASFVSYVVTNIAANVTLQKGVTGLEVEDPNSSDLPDALNTVGPNEAITVLPPNTAGSSTTLFTVYAWDGVEYSTVGKTLKIDLTKPNERPALTFVRQLNGALKDTAFAINYAAVRGNPLDTVNPLQSDAFDVEENKNALSLKLRITNVFTGKLCSGSGSCSAPGLQPSFASPTLFDTADTFNWTPPSGQTGLIKAFSVVAYDGELQSLSEIPVWINVTGPNVLPAFVAETALAGASEDVPFVISYDALSLNYKGSDDQVLPLKYKVTSINSTNGSLQTSAGAVAVVGTLLDVGQYLVWTPAANTSGSLIEAFDVKLVDGNGAESSLAKTVRVNVTSVPDQPVASLKTGNGGMLAAVSKNSGTTFTFDNVAALLNITDADYLGAIPAGSHDFRIESVGSGVLRENSALGALIAPNLANPSGTMPTLVKTVAGQNKPITAIHWSAPTGASGVFTVMTIRVLDTQALAATTLDIKVEVLPSNATPTFSVAVANASNTLTLQNGTHKNGALEIGANALVTALDAQDADGQVVGLRLTGFDPLYTASVKVNGTTYTASADLVSANVVLQAGQTLVWTPKANEFNASGLAAFKLKVTDGTADSAEVTVKVPVSDTNTAPRHSAAATISSGMRNDFLDIPFATLKTALSIIDDETTNADNLIFKIQDVSSGTLKVGADLWSSTNNTLVSTATIPSLFWKPELNFLNGVAPAFRVTVLDPQGLSSGKFAQVSVNVTVGSNAAPVSASDYSVGTKTAGVPFLLTYEDIKSGIGASDVDDPSTFKLVVTLLPSLPNAKLVLGGTEMGTTTVTSTTLPTNPNALSLIGAGDTVVVVSSRTISGAQPLFRVRAWDGTTYSSERIVNATFSATNEKPTIAFIRDLENATQDTLYSLTYADIRGTAPFTSSPLRTDAFDVEENLASPSLKFRIVSVDNGWLCSSAQTTVGDCATNALNPNPDIEPGQTYKWVPPTGVSGRVRAFTVAAYDGTQASLGSVGLHVLVSATNSAPTFAAATSTPFTGGFEDVPYNISYDMLNSNYRGVDNQPTPLKYRIKSIAAGGILRNGNTTLSANSEIMPGDVVTWTPAANVSGVARNAFEVALVDLSNVESASRWVQVDLTAVNDTPVLSRIAANNLTAPTTTAGLAYSYANVAALFNITDPDGPATTQFRIEGAGAGTLSVGTAAGGTQITGATGHSLVDTNTTGTNLTSNVFWVPPLGASGTYTVMTVRGFDGANASATAFDILVTIGALNTAPVWSALVVSDAVTLANGTSKNGQLPISWSTLQSATGVTDAQSQVISFKFTEVVAGELLVTNSLGVTTTYTVGVIGTTVKVGPGESFVWKPAANTSGLTSAFKIVATDSLADTATAVTVKVNVDNTNTAPTLASGYLYSGATRNQYFEMTFASLRDALAISDAPGETATNDLVFKVESASVNQELRIGNSAAGGGSVATAAAAATPFNAVSNSNFGSGQSLFWKAPVNTNGEFEAFKLSVLDAVAGGLKSSNIATVRINVNLGSNAAPTIGNAAPQSLANQTVGQPFVVTYSDLVTEVAPQDTDGSVFSFVVTAIEPGVVLKKGADNMTATTSNPPGALSRIGAGESMVVYTNSSTTGSPINLFTVRVFDGESYSVSSSDVTIRVTQDVSTFNQAPLLTYVRDFTNGVKGQALTVSFTDIRGDYTKPIGSERSDAFDLESNPGLSFRLKAVNTDAGSFFCLSSASPCDNGSKLAIDTVLASGQSFKWVPPTGVTGRTYAFSIVAYDGALESLTSIPVYVQLAGGNMTPSITSASKLTGALEDVPFRISYDRLRLNYPASDDQAGPLSYEITAVSAGSLVINSGAPNAVSTSVVAGTSRLSLGGYLEWTPAANVNGDINAFTIKPVDDANDKPANPTQVVVAVQAVNDVPVVSAAPNKLSNFTKNQGQTITYATLHGLFSGKVSDTESDSIRYRIERVGSGTLRRDNSIIDTSTSAVMPMLVSSIGSEPNPVTSVYWEPPSNAAGTNFVVMTVRPFDGTSYATTAWDILVDVTDTNAAPVLGAGVVGQGYTVTVNNTVSDPVAENQIYTVTYGKLSAAVPATDTEPVKYRIMAVSSGTLTVGSNSYTSASSIPANTFLSSGEWALWTPATNANGLQSAFTVRAADGTVTGEDSNTVTVRVDITPVNAVPKIVGPYTVTGVSRNTYKEVTFADLRDNLAATDDETSPANMKVRVSTVLSGQAVRIGASGLANAAAIENASTGAPLYGSGNKDISNGKSLYWKPVTNEGGSPAVTFDALEFRAVDEAGQQSTNTALLKMTIDSGSVVGPALSVTGGGTTKSLGNTYTLNTPFSVTYDWLESNLNLVRGDNPFVTFVVTNTQNSTLKKGSQDIVAWANAPAQGPASNAVLAKGESLVIVPSTSTTGSAVTLFKVRAYDATNSHYSSAEITLTAQFTGASVNQVPYLTTISDFLGGQKGLNYGITYTSLRAKTNAYDAEEVPEVAQTLKFKLKTIDTTKGNLYAFGDNLFANPYAANALINPGDSLIWKPDAATVGYVAAFTVVAFDGTSESVSPVAVNINIPANTAPTFVSTAAFIPGGREDVPYYIDYNVLFQYFPGNDSQTGTLGYRLTDIPTATGTLSQNGVTITSGNLPTLYPGDAPLVWTPASAANGIQQAFKMKLWDGTDLSAVEATVNVSLASVNNAPVISSASALTSVAKNSNKAIIFSDVFNAISFVDRDYGPTKHAIGANPNLKFRIESVGSGTLRQTSNTGTIINPVPGAVATMPYLVASSPGANEVTTVNWTPSQGLTGNYVAMSVRIFDGTDFSYTTANIVVPVSAGNTKPTYTATSFFTLGVDGGTAGTSENGALQILYSTLQTLSGATDADGDVVRFKIPSVTTGKLTVGNTEYTSASNTSAILLSPGDRVVWAPDANTQGNLNAFTIRATDGTADADTTLTVKVAVSDVNQPPTIANTSVTITGGNRNVVKEITYSALKTALGASDPEDDNDANAATNLQFYVEDLVSGQKLTVGNSGVVSTVSYFTQRTVSTTESFYWDPPENATGTFEAFIVTAVDSTNNSSLTSAKVSVEITGTNQTPAYTNATASFSYTVNRGGTQLWSNGTVASAVDLKTLTGAYDPDTSLVSFVVTYVNPNLNAVIGTLKKGTTNITAYAGTGAVSTSSILTFGERIDLVVDTNAATGTYDLFKVKAFDGVALGAERTISLTVAAGGTNAVPTINTPVEFIYTSGAAPWYITYANLRANSGAADAEEHPIYLGNSLKFRITLTHVGTDNGGTNPCERGTLQISVGGGAWTTVNIPAAGTPVDVGPNDQLRFTHNTTGNSWCQVNSNTITEIFRVKALDVDGGLSSEASVRIQIP